MGLFQKSVLEKYLKQLDDNIVKEAYKKFQDYFHNPDRQANIRAAKEEQFQEGFLRELFVKILGYTINPEPDYNLTSEFKNETGAKKADGAILIDGNAIGVIELKGTDTKDLDKINDQAFSYKNNQSSCVYVVTSNFEKLRFFIQNAVEHEELNLFELTEEEFKLLWVCLQKDNLLAGIPEKIKEESLLEEEKVTKRLYADYSAFKRELWHDMVQRNPEYDELLLFKKSQKLLDRFLFILFSEDKGLLPPNSISEIVNQWQDLKDLDEYRPLYDRYKKYFGYMNTGFIGKKYEIHAYNGGLFCDDEVLDSVAIDDEVLRKHTMKLTEYDFNSDVDVNILGHIFEHSLSEIENVRAKLEGIDVDKSKSKRKKDGVFYTPRYITKYIVDNTVGRLCVEKKEFLGITDERFREAGKRTRKGIKDLEEYREWLLGLTICDPACGSGAFLNQALEFLINEHTWLDELVAEYHGSNIVFPDMEKHILENNLYGVDINEESIEIAKLSLWLRTAKQGRKLTALNDNIKCGNSLIDDPQVAGEKAFKWESEFPEIFTKGGFDVIIGNPPYVRVQSLNHSEVDWFKANKEVAHKRVDISIIFFELGANILKNGGKLSFITSNQFLSAEYGRKCRELFLTKFKIEKIVDFGDLPIFEDALTYVSIFTLQKGIPKDFNYSKIKTMGEAFSTHWEDHIRMTISSLSDDTWVLQDERVDNLIKKVESHPKLSDFGNCNYGIVSGNDSVFIVNPRVIRSHNLEKESVLPLIRANNCKRYGIVDFDQYIIYPFTLENGKTILLKEVQLKEKYPNTYKYLLTHKESLSKRKDSRKTYENREDWYALTRFGRIDLFSETKIVYPGETKHNKFGIDKNKAGFSGARVFSITLNDQTKMKFSIYDLLGVLNSKLIEFYLHAISPVKAGGYYSYSSTILNKLPVNLIGSKLTPKVEHIMRNHEEFNKLINSFIRYVNSKYPTVFATRKLESWHELEFGDFIQELNKAIKKEGEEKLSKMDEMEWMDVFETKKAEAKSLKAEIDKTDKEIDAMVYQLYGLTEEEIRIVEES
ncbi:MAG: N-6 DNA methylase [Candidatus Brocadiales bacterium]|nr:N-6 DNA methylase [Candidatus Brocadiales bacterium]